MNQRFYVKNVLFIVYYFPPMGSSGVQRPLKFIKYLREFGWNPIVIAPEPGAYHTFDKSLEEELLNMEVDVHRVKAFTPFHLAGRQQREINFIPDWLAELARGILSFFYLPDNKTGWIKPALYVADTLIKEHNIDLVFSTSPPPSNHLISAEISKKHGIPAVMDFRDDWLEYQSATYPTRWHKRKNARIEKETVNAASGVIANNKATLDSIRSRTDPDKKKPFRTIYHGYDPEDFREISQSKSKNQKFTILHSGHFYQERQPDILLNALSALVEDGFLDKSDFELHFQGGLEPMHHKKIEKLGFTQNVVDYGYVNHAEAVQNLFKADLLWFIIHHKNQSRTVTPGKMFEYIATGKPIFGLIEEGESRDILRTYKRGYFADPDDLKQVTTTLKEIITVWRENNIPKADASVIKKHDRRLLTGELAQFFDEIAG